MTLVRRQKGIIATLVLYWPTLFVLGHIPVPQIIRRAHMSDKSLHLLAYMILTFLLWSAIKPREKVRWRKAFVWCLLAMVAVYGVCDEYLQSFVADRTMDPKDFLADVVGTVAALAVLTVCSFWPAAVIVAGATIYTLTVFTRANLTALLPVAMGVFHLSTYAVFTLLWIGCMRQGLSLKRNSFVWLVALAGLPAALLVATEVSAMVSGKPFVGEDVIAAAAGILGSITAISIAGLLDRRDARHAGLSPTVNAS
jgi:VanZ family protein